MSLDAYLKLLDWTGRQERGAASESSRRAVIPSDLQPILDRLRIVGDAWLDSVRHSGRRFDRAPWHRRERAIRRRSCLHAFSEEIGKVVRHSSCAFLTFFAIS